MKALERDQRKVLTYLLVTKWQLIMAFLAARMVASKTKFYFTETHQKEPYLFVIICKSYTYLILVT